MEQTVFCVDIGTSSIKTALITASGDVLSAARFRFPRTTRRTSHWLDAYRLALRALKPEDSAAAVVISGNGPTLVSVDGRNRATALLLWNDTDTSTNPGNYAGPSLFIPRILEFSHRFPREYREAHHLLSGPEYLMFSLTGNPVTVLPEERYRPAYWTSDDFTATGLNPAKMPPFVPAGSIAGETTLGKRKHIPVIAGGPDFFVALAGTGAFEPGRACDRAGTSEGLNVCTKDPVHHSRIRTLPSLLPEYWNAAWLLPESGATFHDYRKSSGESGKPHPELMREILESPSAGPGKENVHPGRTVVEHIGFAVREGIETLEEATGYNPVFYLSGGQARNEVWNQMKADITGRTFVLTATADGELMGNAVLASPALGWHTSITNASQAMVRECRRFEPDPENFRRYSDKYDYWKTTRDENV
ncbi:MAG TPA: FGGY-family carbohydrate kinase [Treponemataceae bacterium]|nr:FGGY-family carbohydrate kinase [Treponemataceae bacterium]